MSSTEEEKSQQKADRLDDFAQSPERGILRELAGFLIHTGKWWLTPLVIILLLLGLLIFLGGTGVAPFIYTLF